MLAVERVVTGRSSESTGVEPDRTVGTMMKNPRKKVAVVLRAYRGCRFVDICEIFTGPVLKRFKKTESNTTQ